MIRSFFETLTRLANGFWTLVFIGLLSMATVVMWHLYQQKRLEALFRAEGMPVTVQIQGADHHGRTIWDTFGNIVYANFTYRNRSYETRLRQDSSWVSSGDRLTLLYHPPTDTFRQRLSVEEPVRLRGVSRLIGWSVLRDVSPAYQALGGLVLVVLALFFVSAGAIVQLTGFTGVQLIARWSLVLTLGLSAVFFTYNASHYYRYVDELKTHGQVMTVRAEDTDRHRGHSARRKTTQWNQYYYDATFVFNGHIRRIAIGADDYERVKTGDNRLTVRYNPAMDDFITVDYSPGFSQLLVAAGVWLLFFLLLWSAVKPTATGRV